VAQLAGISPEYYLRLEQGRGHQPSEQVLRSLARALNLDSYAVQYMVRLARLESHSPADPESRFAPISDHIPKRMISRWTTVPVFITDRNQVIVAHNELAAAVLPGAVVRGDNLVLRVFGNEWRKADLGWRDTAARAVASLRFSGSPTDAYFQDLVGILAMRDADFRDLWALHDASPIPAAELRVQTEQFGPVRFIQQAMRPAGDEEHLVTVLHAEPGTAGARMLGALKHRGAQETVADRLAG
jgi:transcriptional regulator with XRE-family HTH domain